MRIILLTAYLIIWAVTAQAADIGPALVNTFGHEGGFQRDPDDSGNWYRGENVGTKYGIAGKGYAGYFRKKGKEIKDITLEDAAQIYGSDFWGASRCNEWKSQLVAENYFELAVNAGQGAAARVIQRAANRAAWPKPPLVVDGVIGPKTIERINNVNQELLMIHFIGLTYALYEKVVVANPVKAKYVRTWALRWGGNIKRTVRQYDARRKS